MFINCGVIYGVASDAQKRLVAKASSDRAPAGNDALIAIVFSAASLEAFINELGEQAGQPIRGASQPQALEAFATLWNEMERVRGSIELKFNMAAFAFTGGVFDKGSQPYQDFAKLMRVRNALVHLRPLDEVTGMEITITPAKLLSQLPRNVLTTNPRASWVTRICTLAMATWACNAAVDMAQAVVGMVPDSYFKRTVVDAAFAPAFQRV